MAELRQDLLSGDWVVYAQERGRRPRDFQGRAHDHAGEEPGRPCPFCAFYAEGGDRELIAERDAPGGSVKVVANGFPMLRPENGHWRGIEGIYARQGAVGAHEVVLEGSDHDGSLAAAGVSQIKEVLLTWRDRVVDLSRDARLRTISVFKNRGPMAGASMRHPHSQVVATPVLAPRLAREIDRSIEHFQAHERPLMGDIVAHEVAARERIVRVDDGYLSFSPWASRVPFEVIVSPRAQVHDFGLLSDDEADLLAGHLEEVLGRLQIALDTPDYNLMVVSAPNACALPPGDPRAALGPHAFRWRLEIMPRTHPVAGFEWNTGMYANPTLPEAAAAHLRGIDWR